MNQKPYQVEAFWDREAQVWVAESEDIPGLVTEDDSRIITTQSSNYS